MHVCEWMLGLPLLPKYWHIKYSLLIKEIWADKKRMKRIVNRIIKKNTTSPLGGYSVTELINYTHAYFVTVGLKWFTVRIMAYSYFECHFHAPYTSYPNLNFSLAALAMVHFGARLVFSFVILPCIIDCQSRSFLIICVPSIPKLIDFAVTQIVLSMLFFIQNQISYLQFQPINC